MYIVKYYVENNQSPVVTFIQEQSPKEQAKILREVDLLEEFGLFLGMPHIKKLKGYNDLWELRIKHSTKIFRIIFLIIKMVSLFYCTVLRKKLIKHLKKKYIKLLLEFKILLSEVK